MQKCRFACAVFCLCALLLVTVARSAAQDVNFVGTWQMSMADNGQGQNGGGEGRHGGRGGAQALTITKNGDKFQVTHKTQRGDKTSDATVSGNTISWTEQREGRDGETMTISYKATVDGDSMNGSTTGGRASRNFTAKRSN
jgi:hypothetical protein